MKWKRIDLLMLLVIWLLLPACEPFDDDDDNGSQPMSGNAAVIDHETGRQLEALVEARRQEYGIPGIVLAVRKAGQPTWSTAAGFSDLETRTPMRADDTFRIGSNTKTFTASMVLKIMEDRGYKLDEPVADHLPDLPLWLDDYVGTHGFAIEDIRIRHLLQHTSGLLNFTENPKWTTVFLNAPDTQYTPLDLLDLADVPEAGPELPPGVKVAYSNTNYVLLGLLIETWTGGRYEDVVRDDLIHLQGLYNTTVPRTGDYTMALASANGFWSEGYMDFDGDGQIATEEKVSDQDPSFTWASGNITATADDLLTWVLALGRGEIAPFFWKEQNTFLPFVEELEYGLGIVRDVVDPDNPDDDLIGHQGGSLGYQSVMMYVPHEDTAVVCFYNITLPPAVKNYARIAVYDALELIFPATFGS